MGMSGYKIVLLVGGVVILVMLLLPQRFLPTHRYKTRGNVADWSIPNTEQLKVSKEPSTIAAKRTDNLIFSFNAASGVLDENIVPYACVPLKALVTKGVICIYDPAIDIYVSYSLQKTGIWEEPLVDLLLNFLKQYNNMEFLDLGANLGVYSIFATQLGRRVVAVDANVQNLRLVSRSLALSGLQKHKVTLIWNAISDKEETLQLKFGEKNIGGTHVVDLEADRKLQDVPVKTHAVTLDHLVPLFQGRQLFIKMDIELTEWKALKNGSEFFKVVDVKYVLMEWEHYKKDSSHVEAELICSFFTVRSYKPYNPRKLSDGVLSIENSNKWPYDVLWVREGSNTNLKP